ncbi:MarR family transcriptional regulator [Salmonella enterica]|nr:MarR family transcriptional regulator [Salmonella enterica]
MKISLINDKFVLNAIGKMRYGEPTYYIKNLLSYTYPGIDTPSVLRKLKDMEKRGLIRRVKSPHFHNNISWTK